MWKDTYGSSMGVWLLDLCSFMHLYNSTTSLITLRAPVAIPSEILALRCDTRTLQDAIAHLIDIRLSAVVLKEVRGCTFGGADRTWSVHVDLGDRRRCSARESKWGDEEGKLGNCEAARPRGLSQIAAN